MKNIIKKTLVGLVLGIALNVTPVVAQRTNGIIKKVKVSYQNKAKIPRKSTKLYGKDFITEAAEIGENKNSIEGRGLNIYFRSDEHKLDFGDIKDIFQYYSVMGSNIQNIKIEASADREGSNNYNLALSNRRAESVRVELEKRYPKANIETVALGERAGEDLAERRKVKITIDNPISYQIENSNADYILFDFSGSMNDILRGTKIKKVSAVWSANIPEETEAWYFSGKSKSNRLNSIFPAGNTPLYNSIYELIRKAKKGSTIEIYTDGINSQKIKSYSAKNVINYALSKDIKLNIKSIGIPKEKTKIYKKMSESTSGKYLPMQ